MNGLWIDPDDGPPDPDCWGVDPPISEEVAQAVEKAIREYWERP